MACKYKLTYFNIRARGEPARLMFAAADVQFEDCRIEDKDWPAEKKKTPQGSLPILKVDGGKLEIAQSGAINRYLAREFGLYGKNNLEATKIDMIYETLADSVPKRIAAVFETNKTTKAALEKELHEKHAPHFLDILEPLVADYGKDGFAVGNSLSLADVILFTGLEFAKAVPTLKEKKDKYPCLLKNRKKFEEIKEIKAYLVKRPPSDK